MYIYQIDRITKAFADDDNLDVIQPIKFIFDRIENSVGKGENAGDQHFLLFPYCFQNFSSSGMLKLVIVW